ncbi:hypothetical protein D3C81_2062360 [compost metagenome]
MFDLVRAQHFEDLLAVGDVGFVARGTEGRGRRGGHQFQVVAGFLRQIDEFFIDDAAHAVQRAIHARDMLKAP